MRDARRRSAPRRAGRGSGAPSGATRRSRTGSRRESGSRASRRSGTELIGAVSESRPAPDGRWRSARARHTRRSSPRGGSQRRPVPGRREPERGRRPVPAAVAAAAVPVRRASSSRAADPLLVEARQEARRQRPACGPAPPRDGLEPELLADPARGERPEECRRRARMRVASATTSSTPRVRPVGWQPGAGSAATGRRGSCVTASIDSAPVAKVESKEGQPSPRSGCATSSARCS